MKKELVQTLLGALIVAAVAGMYFRLEGALPIAVTQTMKQATFEVSGGGKVIVKPDQAEISLGVNAEGANVRGVTEKVDMQMKLLSSRLKELGIADKDIKTVNYNVYQNYQPEEAAGNSYTVNSTVSVTVRELDKTSEVVDLIGQLGLTQAGGLNFGLSDKLEEESLKEAREEAIMKAKDKAEELAGLAGMKLGRIVNIQEGYMGGMPSPMYVKAESLGRGEDTVATIEPGTSEVAISVTLSYETK